MRQPKMIALTGGPCGGKSSLLARLVNCGTLAGHALFFAPEAATILIDGGFSPKDVFDFQSKTLATQLELEQEALDDAAAYGKDAAIICDRGIVDGAAYCSAGDFARILSSHGLDMPAANARYDSVIHLQSAAIENPSAYSDTSNGARFETLDEAVAQENRTLDAWRSHPNRQILGGYADFDEKMADAIALITASLTREQNGAR